MPDYKQMYFMLFQRASEAVNLLAISPRNARYVAKILVEMQSECEDMYINAVTRTRPTEPEKTAA